MTEEIKGLLKQKMEYILEVEDHLVFGGAKKRVLGW